ncbi:hypothetical protein VB796_21180 [Arcicella sp. LKC2W]|uniref:hypothetical protein n=1 Tax=Arcicella sp. LKC2W TaxID=2984198 RepID=UPI002B20010B|nr:hypothetical protein [Arcicella sp. LKC2W]MEA5461594.1 hypothetical protein [Arcicella sp. LKC2W]
MEKQILEISKKHIGDALGFTILCKDLEPSITSFGSSIDAETEVFYKFESTYIELSELSNDDNGTFYIIATFKFNIDNPKNQKIVSDFASLKGFKSDNF